MDNRNSHSWAVVDYIKIVGRNHILMETGICPQERVDDVIRYVIDKTAKICRKDSRILYCESRQEVNVVIVARDILENDYLITFTNEEME